MTRCKDITSELYNHIFHARLIVAEKISVPESCLPVFRFWQNIEAASGSKAILSCPLLIPAF